MRNILAVLTLGMISPKLPIIKLTIFAIIVFVFYTNPVQAGPVKVPQRLDYDCEDYMHDDLASMACNIYWEGRNQGSEGMLAIAAVTLWRVKSPDYPDTIADVVWEKNWSKRFQRNIAMFSWTLDGKGDHPFQNEQEQWDEAWLIARNFAIDIAQKDSMCPHINETLNAWNAQEEKGKLVTRDPELLRCESYDQLLEAKFYMMSILDKTGGAILYHADYVKPWWMGSYVFSIKIGSHLFYLNEKVTIPPNQAETPE